MHIFIDEAGQFMTPTQRPWSASCVGALVLKDSDVPMVRERFSRLKDDWGVGGAEIKGSDLDERQVKAVIDLLSGFDVMFELTAIDMALQDGGKITAARQAQADVFITGIDDRYTSSLIADLNRIRTSLIGTSNQLYLQGVCTWHLISSVLRRASLYFVQRSPAELGAFRWRFDSKDNTLTPFEKLWTTISLPILESISINEPLGRLEGADYSFFARFEREEPSPPDRLREVIKSGPYRYLDLRAIFAEDRMFIDSRADTGVQLADILTTSARRAMNGNLQQSGWYGLGGLMVQARRGEQVIQMLDLSGAPTRAYVERHPPYLSVIRLTNQTCKPMNRPDKEVLPSDRSGS